MPWLSLMLLHDLFASVYTLFSRKLAKRYQHAHFQIMAAALGVTYLAFLGYGLFHVGQLSWSTVAPHTPQIVVTGVLFAASNIITFVTLRYVDASIGALFQSLHLVGIVLVASLTIGEGLTPTQLVGAAILLVAILVVLTIHLPRISQHRWLVGLSLSVVASVLIGAAVASEKYLLDQIDMPNYAVFAVGIQFAVLVVFALLYRRDQFAHFKERAFRRTVTAMGFVRAGAGLTFVLALVAADNASLIGVLTGLKIILTAMLAALFLHEVTFMKRKLVAATIAFVGVGIMLW